MIRKVFIGCNTAEGFYSFFDFLTNPEDANIIILKGGPGHGKSTFIRSIGEELISKGYDIELQFCSFDCNSLDALALPSHRFAIVATTGHHVKDPRYAGVVEEIINLGEYLCVEGVINHKRTIIEINNEIEEIFRRTYRYLSAAKLMRKNIEDVNSRLQDFAKVNLAAKDILAKTLERREVADHVGYERHLFASSITPEGYCTYIDTLIKGKEIYKILGDWGTGKTTILKKIGEDARAKGLGVEYYHHPLDAEKIEHLIIPKLNTAFITTDDISDEKCRASYNLNAYLKDIEYLEEKNEMEDLINSAVENLKKARKLHEKLENYYIPNMDFEGIDKCREKVLQKILENKYVKSR
ncbi:ATPase [Aceticella autotrophica]|uniref:ATPase n=1 Tax=Aceticella autotrophica TaxID=2755338 RepID=A0A975AXC5_9THEO|nr:hypothetical protein [Aceticella autotrophica]QSZ28123.1 ATPase [Aceticella autotrophica]